MCIRDSISTNQSTALAEADSSGHPDMRIIRPTVRASTARFTSERDVYKRQAVLAFQVGITARQKIEVVQRGKTVVPGDGCFRHDIASVSYTHLVIH